MTDTCTGSLNPSQVICGGTHCNNYVDTDEARRICKCVDYQGKPVPGCLPKTDAYPVETASCYNKQTKVWMAINDDACQNLRDQDRNWSWKKCFCCCSCVAWGTQVRVTPSLVRSIEKINRLDPVMAGSLKLQDGKPVVSWKQMQVIFSDGTTPTDVPNSNRIAYGVDGEIICSGDQPLVLADGSYIVASKVKAGMLLLTDEGKPVEVTGTDLGTHNVGLWHIGTDAPDLHSMDGHLVSFNGLLAGDYIAQQIIGPNLRADDRPEIGSEAYAAGGSRYHSTLPGREPPEIRTKGFVPYRLLERMPIPSDAVRFVTPLQADELRKAPAANPSTSYNLANFERLVRLYRGFFPELHIICQWEMDEPNLFAFNAYGMRTIIVSGALLRVKELGQEGLAFILAHGIARFLGAPPADKAHYACTGQADFFAIGYVINQAYYGNSFELLEEALPQIKKLFGYIKSSGGVNRCEYPSIDCRLQAISAARSGGVLPECAGAPIAGALKLEAAEVISVGELSALVLTFNLPVALPPGGIASNFIIDPVSSVQHANIDPHIPNQIMLTVRFAAEREGEFSIQLYDIRAADGSTLDPEHASARFIVPSPTA